MAAKLLARFRLGEHGCQIAFGQIFVQDHQFRILDLHETDDGFIRAPGIDFSSLKRSQRVSLRSVIIHLRTGKAFLHQLPADRACQNADAGSGQIFQGDSFRLAEGICCWFVFGLQYCQYRARFVIGRTKQHAFLAFFRNGDAAGGKIRLTALHSGQDTAKIHRLHCQPIAVFLAETGGDIHVIAHDAVILHISKGDD